MHDGESRNNTRCDREIYLTQRCHTSRLLSGTVRDHHLVTLSSVAGKSQLRRAQRPDGDCQAHSELRGVIIR